MTTIGRGLVIVTGASSGIGEAIALHLREGGFSVPAGVRRGGDAERLRTRGLTPIRLGITDPEQPAAACAEVGDRPPAGPVNNAGILCGEWFCVTWSYGSQKERGGCRSERCQEQNGHDDVP